MKINLFLLLLIAAALMGAGAYGYYLYGYKDSFWIMGAGYILVILGFIALLWLMIGLHVRILGPGKPGKGRKVAGGFFSVLYLVWLVAMVGGLVWLEYLKEQRVEDILAGEPVHATTAQVIRIESRRIKSSSHIYAVIEYIVDGNKVRQAIKDDARQYTEGQEVNIIYSDAHPDMFKPAPPAD